MKKLISPLTVMNSIPADKFIKIGFISKTAALEFAKANEIKKGRNQSIPQFLQDLKKARIANKKTKTQEKKQFPVYGPKNRNTKIKKASRTLYTSQVANVSLQKEYGTETRKDEFEMKGGRLANLMYKIYPEIPITEELFNRIYGELNFLYERALERVREEYNLHGMPLQTWAQVDYRTNYDEKPYSAFVLHDSFERDEVIDHLRRIALKNYETIDYLALVVSLRIKVRIPSNSGGCLPDNDHSHKTLKTDEKNKSIVLDSYKSSDNNCLFACLNYFYNVKQSPIKREKSNTIRQKLNIPLKTQIAIEDIQKIIDYYNTKYNENKGFILSNESHKIVKYYNIPPENMQETIFGDLSNEIIPLFLYFDHYFLFTVKQAIPCSFCFRPIQDTEKHICNMRVASFARRSLQLHIKREFDEEWNKKYIKYEETFNNKTQKKSYKLLIDYHNMPEEDKIKIKKINESENFVVPYKNNEKDKKKPIVLVYDFESWLQENKAHKVYAVGYTFINKPDYLKMDNSFQYIYHDSSKKSVIEKFLDFLEKVSQEVKKNDPKAEIILSAYNGAKFDVHLILQMLVLRDHKIQIVESNKRLLICKFLNFKVFDLCAFISCSLKSACEDFEVSDDNKKGEFDHKKMQTEEDLFKYKDECVEYLRKDVMGLAELISIVHDTIYYNSKMHIYDYVTLPHMGYTEWTSHLTNTQIEIPAYEKWKKWIYPAMFGGRCNPFQKYYKSKFYDEVMEMKNKIETENAERIQWYKQQIKNADSKKEKKALKKQRAKELYQQLIPLYNKILESGDYIFNADVTGLYPASMGGFKSHHEEEAIKLNKSKYSVNTPVYPTGPSREIENDIVDAEASFYSGKLGFYEITYTCPKDIVIPVLPKSKMHGNRRVGLVFDLIDSTGIFTSVDIENAKAFGYDIIFTGNALVYDQKVPENLFMRYVRNYEELKAKGEKEGNSALRTMGKLFLNALYGKTMQRPIVEETKIIDDIFEFDEFVRLNNLQDIYRIDSTNKYLVRGSKKDLNIAVTKPAQLGAFVTAYSRRVMLHYMSEMDPTLKEFTFSYTDTDSLHCHGKYAKSLKDNGWLVRKENSQPGLLCSDCDNEGIIIAEINLGPKSYMYTYIDECGNVEVVMKTKGIPQEYLKMDMFIKEAETLIKMDNRIKKTGSHPTKSNLDQSISYFSIYNENMTRTFLKNKWKVYDLIDNNFYAPGSEHLNYIYPIQDDIFD